MNHRPKIIYRLGDRVRIKSGPFTAFTGRIEGINQSKSLLKVSIDIFGSVTPVKVTFWDAEKLEFEPPSPPTSTQS
jgi:transcription termination/antitermination protein NusG